MPPGILLLAIDETKFTQKVPAPTSAVHPQVKPALPADLSEDVLAAGGRHLHQTGVDVVERAATQLDARVVVRVDVSVPVEGTVLQPLGIPARELEPQSLRPDLLREVQGQPETGNISTVPISCGRCRVSHGQRRNRSTVPISCGGEGVSEE